MSTLSRIREFIRCVVRISVDVLTFFCLSLRSSAALAAENLFLRKQLALYVEIETPWRSTDSVRFTLAQLARFFKWRDVLTVVKPDTLVRWHHKGFRLFWKWKSRSRGRPRVSVELQKLMAEMATNNTTWGEERIANELWLKIGIQISPRTVRRYLPTEPKHPKVVSQHLMTFRPESFQDDHCSGLFRRRNSDISARLCARDQGDWDTTHSSLQRDSASDCCMDLATVPRVCGGRRRLQIHHS
jgi:hypothetical protein